MSSNRGHYGKTWLARKRFERALKIAEQENVMSKGPAKKKTKRVWKPTIGAKLGSQEQKLRDALTTKPCDIELLFRCVTGNFSKPSKALLPRRKIQQRIGAIAARHNRKVKSPHIVRGDKPGTYRLKRVR